MSMYAACDGESRTTKQECDLANQCLRFRLGANPDAMQVYLIPEVVGNCCEHFIKEKTDDDDR